MLLLPLLLLLLLLLLPPQSQEGCLARRLLLLLPDIGPSPADAQGLLLTEAVTLMLLLLYDSPFKFEVTVHLLDCYQWLLQLVGEAREAEGEALSAALDRLTVQLFNAESVSAGVVGQRGGVSDTALLAIVRWERAPSHPCLSRILPHGPPF